MCRALLLIALCLAAFAQQEPQPTESTWTLSDFFFNSGDRLPALKLHYLTLGKPERDAAGHTRNAVLILHGTGSSSTPFLAAGFLGALFLSGQPLDAEKYFIILPDAIGHGDSSKPSDGLRARFPAYDYD